MNKKEHYEKLLAMIDEGMGRVHDAYMAEMDKGMDTAVARDYAMSMASFATLLTAAGMLRPPAPWPSMSFCATGGEKS